MSDKILSVIIPAYNAEPYLNKCLSSLVFDGMDEVEVMVVNDGSTDATITIAESYAATYPGVFRVISKPNGGHGSAINAAISGVTGKYIRALDADDWVLTQNIPAYLSYLKESDADIVLTHFHAVDRVSGVRTPYINSLAPFNLKYGLSYPPESVNAFASTADRYFRYHTVSYRTDFYRSIGLTLSEGIFYEDQEYAVIPFLRCGSVAFLDLSVYEYLIGNSSQSMSITNQAMRHSHLKAVLLRVLAEYSSVSDGSVQKTFLLSRLRRMAITYEKVALLYLSDKKEGRRLSSEIKREISRIDPSILRGSGIKRAVFYILNAVRANPAWVEKIYGNLRQTR